ncbi:phytochelatin synthase [Skeletonema marinoi]|uniref:glutathione gamma-glutamylcysteinyltransferase n=1 Tax=Skeletonema marinoi TaxID=267567 RepID=A0AAD8YEU0_9STRA|nr:phytochelatin synthase [Skeletonema marinoi]
MRGAVRLFVPGRGSHKRIRVTVSADFLPSVTSSCLQLSSMRTTCSSGQHSFICGSIQSHNPHNRHNYFNTLSYSSAASTDDAHSSQRDAECINHNDTNNNSCHLSEPLVKPGTPLPPPLPNPNYSFRGRALPTNLIAFNSTEGKQRFMQALQNDCAESYFPLSQQFLNQMDPAYCGITTLVLILNALAIDPNVRWRGGWRWYGDEQICQGVDVKKKRPLRDRGEQRNVAGSSLDAHDIHEFRNDIRNAVRMPPKTQQETDLEIATHADAHNDSQARACNGGYFLVTSFGRSSLSQTGDGHFSPIAAYHEPSDSCLVLDVARFKYAPYWVTVKDLYDAMIPEDKATGQSRGWLLMYPPTKGKHGSKKSLTVEEIEGKRPAACVPLAGSGVSLCAVEKIKVDYCSVNNNR